MNKKLFVISGLLVCILCMSLSSAFFLKSHEYWTLKAFKETSSPIKTMCADRLTQMMDGNTAADVPVLHYYDEDVFSYISTHTRGVGFQECLTEAGSDIDLKCFCYGIGLHNVQDHYSHTLNGIVSKYLKKYWASNLPGHMVVEKDYEVKHMQYLRDQADPYYDEIEFYDSRVLDHFFIETGGEEKYVKLMNSVTGLDIENDLNLFANGYKGQGFYDTVYKEKLKLPWWFWGIGFGAVIIGLGMTLLILITGRTWWRVLAMLPWLILLILGILVLVSFLMNSTWQWFEYGLRIPAKLGYLSVGMEDVELYNNLIIAESKYFLETGVLKFDDNTGLSYEDRDGTWQDGALITAETKFKFIFLPIIATLFILLNVFLLVKTYRGGKKMKGGKSK